MLGFCGVTRAKTFGVKGSEPALLKIRCILLGRSRTSDSGNETGASFIQQSEEKSKARIDIDLVVKPRQMSQVVNITDIDMDIDVDVSASKVYGFANEEQSPQISEAEIADLLSTAIHPKDRSMRWLGNGVWRNAVREVEKTLFS
jgi:kinetochore protein Spc7/SPC105